MSSCPPSGRRAPVDAGLTLIELLVASAVAAILIVAVYYVYTATTQGYRLQGQMMGAMQQARFGLDQLQRDLSSAGFLATPSATADNSVCPKPLQRLPGVVFSVAGDVHNPTRNDNVHPQAVTMLGAFWSPAIFYTHNIDGATVTLLDGVASGGTFPQSQDEFTRLFRSPRFLRIVNADQFEMYLPIASADYANRTITLSSNVPLTAPPGSCGLQGHGVGLEVSVAGYVRYLLSGDPSTDPNEDPGKIDLIREEIDGNDPDLDTVVRNSTLRVAEYVVDLEFTDFTFDIGQVGQAPQMQQVATLAAVNASTERTLDTSAQARPQDLRFVTAILTTRTQHEDESFLFRQRTTANVPLESYDLDPTMVGSAHTVALASRVGLPSFLVRNVK